MCWKSALKPFNLDWNGDEKQLNICMRIYYPTLPLPFSQFPFICSYFNNSHLVSDKCYLLVVRGLQLREKSSLNSLVVFL